jgi:hypothetical protein
MRVAQRTALNAITCFARALNPLLKFGLMRAALRG